MQGTLGILQSTINWYTSPTKINKTTPSVDQNCWLKSIDTNSLKPTNKNLIKVSNIFEPTNKIIKIKTLDTIAI